MSALLGLAARCEAASGPDRELDAAIAVALNIGARGLLADDHEYLELVRKDDGCAVGTYWFKCRSGMSLRTAEPYTASLDAAMTLVPEGDRRWELTTEASASDPRFGPYQARVHIDEVVDDPDSDGPQGIGNGLTPALALCAAALRAREATKQSEVNAELGK